MLRTWAPAVGIVALIAAFGLWLALVFIKSNAPLPKERLVPEPPRTAMLNDGVASKMLLGGTDLPADALMALGVSRVLPLVKTQWTRECYGNEPSGRTGLAETAWQFGGGETVYESISVFDSAADADAYVRAQRTADQCLVEAIQAGKADYTYVDNGIFFDGALLTVSREMTDGLAQDMYSLDYAATVNHAAPKARQFSDVFVMRNENVAALLRVYQNDSPAGAGTVLQLARAAQRKIAPT